VEPELKLGTAGASPRIGGRAGGQVRLIIRRISQLSPQASEPVLPAPHSDMRADGILGDHQARFPSLRGRRESWALSHRGLCSGAINWTLSEQRLSELTPELEKPHYPHYTECDGDDTSPKLPPLATTGAHCTLVHAE
jgi:hypothetical protein